MHLLILGLILVVGILAYYIMTTSPGSGKSSDAKNSKIKRHNQPEEEESHVPEDLRKEDNVIFLPTADGSRPDTASSRPDTASSSRPDTASSSRSDSDSDTDTDTDTDE